MIKRHRVYNLLINNAYKSLKQAVIPATCKCTTVYSSRLVKKLLKKNILQKHAKNSILVSNPLMLAFILGFEKDFGIPLCFKFSNYNDAITILNTTTYSLTLDSALSIKRGLVPKKLQAYVLGKDIPELMENFTTSVKDPDLIVYSSDMFRFLHQNLVNNVFTVSDWDLLVDLLANSAVNTALTFAKEFKLFKTINRV
ncbi:Uncharacterised protein [Candidatus Tiddalikarchaeum anstoanum]|nr:Uncharacterised protein [Candidatus Tiddalikarchaeum anstoanum]